MDTARRDPSIIVDALAARLKAEPAPGLVSLYRFGSYASDRTHRESDVDLAILLDRRVHASREARFQERGRMSAWATGALHVDVVVLNDAPPHLGRQHIVTSGAPLLRRRRWRSLVRPRRAAPRRRPRAVPPAHAPHQARRPRSMTFLVERRADLRRHRDPLRELGTSRGWRCSSAMSKTRARRAARRRPVAAQRRAVLSAHGVSAGDRHRRRAVREAWRSFRGLHGGRAESRPGPRFPGELVGQLATLPGFRNVVVHEYVGLDLDRVLGRWPSWSQWSGSQRSSGKCCGRPADRPVAVAGLSRWAVEDRSEGARPATMPPRPARRT
jgi:predicted nucleotidyltransferase